MMQPNPQSDSEIFDSFDEARKHPSIFIMKKESQLSTIHRRWTDLEKFEGNAETFYQMASQHMDMALTAMRLLRNAIEKKNV